MGYYAEIPAVVFDVQRVGPSTGMPTRVQQADILACAYASHGDTKHILLFPAHPAECFEMAANAFDLAERFQTPVFVLSDLDIGMNDWVSPALDLGRFLRARPRPRPRRRRPARARGVPPLRTGGCRVGRGAHAPGRERARAPISRAGPATRSRAGTPRYPEEYQAVLDRLARKHTAAAEHMPPPLVDAARARAARRSSRSAAASWRSWRRSSCSPKRESSPTTCASAASPSAPGCAPSSTSTRPSWSSSRTATAQLRTLLTLETPVSKEKLRSVLAYGGYPLSAEDVVDGVTKILEA